MNQALVQDLEILASCWKSIVSHFKWQIDNCEIFRRLFNTRATNANFSISYWKEHFIRETRHTIAFADRRDSFVER